MLAIRDIPWALMILIADCHHVENVAVCVPPAEPKGQELVAAVGQALRLIAEHDAKRLARIRRDIRRILITEESGSSFLPRLDVCRLGMDMTIRGNALGLAMAIVHEATHARLWHAGIGYDEHSRARIERICVGQEIAFAELVPNSEAEIRKISTLLDTSWWTTDQLNAHAIAELRRLGCPEWLLRHFKAKT